MGLLKKFDKTWFAERHLGVFLMNEHSKREKMHQELTTVFKSLQLGSHEDAVCNVRWGSPRQIQALQGCKIAPIWDYIQMLIIKFQLIQPLIVHKTLWQTPKLGIQSQSQRTTCNQYTSKSLRSMEHCLRPCPLKGLHEWTSRRCCRLHAHLPILTVASIASTEHSCETRHHALILS